MALVILGVVGLSGAAAAASAPLYVTPTSSGTPAVGAAWAVEVHTNSGAETVNAVQANIAYDANGLQFLGVDTTGTAYSLMADTKIAAGLVKMARATGGGEPPVSGDKLFATLRFKVLNPKAIDSVKVVAGSHVVRSTDAADLIGAGSGDDPEVTPAPNATSHISTSAGWVWGVVVLTIAGALSMVSGALLYWYERKIKR
jgi:hypothetical protein